MQIDQTTYHDLSIFHSEDDCSVFHKLDFTRTAGGRDAFHRHFNKPAMDIGQIHDTQAVIRIVRDKLHLWPESISNGTLLVMEKFLDYNLDPLPHSAGILHSSMYRLLHGPDYSLTRYSLMHFRDFVIGLREIVHLLDLPEAPPKLRTAIAEVNRMLLYKQMDELSAHAAGTPFSLHQTIHYGRFFHETTRYQMQKLIQLYAQFDAWYAMAKAMDVYDLHFPELSEDPDPYIEAKGLYHLLLDHPIPYDLDMNPASNFIFLTGANMAGKSTFIKAVGLAVFLAHLGMGVPAARMRLTMFDGILSNINVVDNIAKGESYFFNEVQRIRLTVETINDQRRWLVLIDELFKGTNIQDAMKCSSLVIKGLIRIKRAMFILSTHLYEIGDELKIYPNISFRYFETSIVDEELAFSYQLKEGISNDRLGYLILKREKVVEMLENL